LNSDLKNVLLCAVQMDSVKRLMKLEMLELKHKVGTVQKQMEKQIEMKFECLKKTLDGQIRQDKMLEKKMDDILAILHQQGPEPGADHFSGGLDLKVQAKATSFLASKDGQPDTLAFEPQTP
jgi:hypothetical protein